MFNISLSRNAAVIVFALIASACSGGEKAEKETSKSVVTEAISDNTYRNDHFGITVSKPDDWYALTLEQQEQMLGMGTDLASSGNDDMRRVLDASAKRNHPLFSFFMHEPGTPVPMNANVMGIAENVGLLTGVKTGEDYFFHAKKLMSQTGMDYQFTDEFGKRDIGGVTFDAMDVKLTFNGTVVEQTYYAARHDNYFIAIIDSYGTKEFESETSKIIDSISLDW